MGAEAHATTTSSCMHATVPGGAVPPDWHEVMQKAIAKNCEVLSGRKGEQAHQHFAGLLSSWDAGHWEGLS
eukprot:7727572-Pyramimonas_sp.AAC.1